MTTRVEDTGTRTMIDGLRVGLRWALESHENAVLFGQDIGHFGGPHRISLGLIDEFGNGRVIDTPISEAGVTSLAMGAAMAGMRPIVEIHFAGLLPIIAEELNQLGLVSYRTGAQWNAPVLIRARTGAVAGRQPVGNQHCESEFLYTPGLRIVGPVDYCSAIWAIESYFDANTPQLMVEQPYSRVRQENPLLPADWHEDGAYLAGSGTDILLISWLGMCELAHDVAEKLYQGDGTECSVLEIVQLKPLPDEVILSVAARMKRVVVIQEAPLPGSVGATILAKLGVEASTSAVPRLLIEPLNYPYAVEAGRAKEQMHSTESVASRIRSWIKE